MKRFVSISDIKSETTLNDLSTTINEYLGWSMPWVAYSYYKNGINPDSQNQVLLNSRDILYTFSGSGRIYYSTGGANYWNEVKYLKPSDLSSLIIFKKATQTVTIPANTETDYKFDTSAPDGYTCVGITSLDIANMNHISITNFFVESAETVNVGVMNHSSTQFTKIIRYCLLYAKSTYVTYI